jgi:hypothetical protein
MLSVRVTRPDELAEILAPLTPALTPMLFGVTVILMPGAILKDLRTLNPIPAPMLMIRRCWPAPGLSIGFSARWLHHGDQILGPRPSCSPDAGSPGRLGPYGRQAARQRQD